MLLAITSSALINLLIWLIIIGLIFSVIWWALSQIPIAEPFNKVIRVLLVLIAAILIINVLLTLTGVHLL